VRRWLFGCAIALALPAGATAHPARPEEPTSPQIRNYLIPEDDRPRYRSRVTAIDPRLPELRARVQGGQDRFELEWRGQAPLLVGDGHGDPMFRMSPIGVEVNRRSPAVWRSVERFGRVPIPKGAKRDLRPEWQILTGPGVWRWFDYRIQWRRRERPAVVGDGLRRTTILRWRIPVRTYDGRSATIHGVLEWLPDPGEVRGARSDVSNPLLSAFILLAAMAGGGGIGVVVRERRAKVGAGSAH
jgi:hypothetical protein